MSLPCEALEETTGFLWCVFMALSVLSTLYWVGDLEVIYHFGNMLIHLNGICITCGVLNDNATLYILVGYKTC